MKSRREIENRLKTEIAELKWAEKQPKGFGGICLPRCELTWQGAINALEWVLRGDDMEIERFDLSRKIVILTGNKGFLGQKWERILKDRGAYVVGLDLPEKDVTKVFDIVSLANELPDLPDIIINNCAIDNPPGSKASFWENWQDIINVNLGGTIKMCFHFIPQNIKEKKKLNIVNIGSMLGFIAADYRNYEVGWDKPLGYGASKAAIWNFTMNCNVRYAKHGIINNMLALSCVENNQGEPFRSRYIDKIPIHRMLVEDDFAMEFLTACTSRVPYDMPLFVGGGWCSW